MVFHAGRVFVVKKLLKTGNQKFQHDLSYFRRVKLSILLVNVLPVLNGAQNAGVCAWPADPLGFKSLHQTRFVVTRRRLSKMLSRQKLLQFQDFTLMHLGQNCFLLLGTGITLFGFGFLVDCKKARKFCYRSCGFEFHSSGINLHIGLIEQGGIHLRGNKAVPDQRIQFPKLRFQITLEALRRPFDRGGPDGFMGPLSGFLRFVIDRVMRKIGFAKISPD